MKLFIKITSGKINDVCSLWPYIINWVLPILLTLFLVSGFIYVIKRLFCNNKKKVPSVYHLSRNGQWTTPYTMSEIEEMIKNGIINDSYYIKVKEPDIWNRISNIPHLQNKLMGYI